MIKLYDYFRSTASYRVRIALNYKGIPFETIPVQLKEGEQHQSDYLKLNPQGLVPTLEVNGSRLTQSLAIIDYLEMTQPDPALLPDAPLAQAHIRSLALIIACDMHPLNNLRVLQTLKQTFQATELQTKAWYHQWLKAGFDAFESHLKTLPRSMPVCYGNRISLADICLIPQVYNAERFEFAMDNYPLIQQINTYCLQQDAFIKSCPREC